MKTKAISHRTLKGVLRDLTAASAAALIELEAVQEYDGYAESTEKILDQLAEAVKASNSILGTETKTPTPA